MKSKYWIEVQENGKLYQGKAVLKTGTFWKMSGFLIGLPLMLAGGIKLGSDLHDHMKARAEEKAKRAAWKARR